MRVEKKIVIEISRAERDVLREIVNAVEKTFNIDIDEEPETFTEVISGIRYGYKKILPSTGDEAEIVYKENP